MHSTVCFDRSTSKSFPFFSGVTEQGCLLAPTLFSIFFSLLLRHAFKYCIEGVCIHTRADGRLFNIARLRAETKVTSVLIRGMLFADDAALATYTEDGLQKPLTAFPMREHFGPTISLKKTKILAKGSDNPPTISIDY